MPATALVAVQWPPAVPPPWLGACWHHSGTEPGVVSCVHQVVAAEFEAAIHTITAGTVLGAATGESERRLREAFAAAAADSSGGAGRPVVLLLDELDALCPRRSGGRPHEARVVAQLLTLLDSAAVALPGGTPLVSIHP